jgi:hypothetical protein
MIYIILQGFFVLLLILLLLGLLFLCTYKIIKISKNKKISNTKKGLSIFGLIVAIIILISQLSGIFKLFINSYLSYKI